MGRRGASATAAGLHEILRQLSPLSPSPSLLSLSWNVDLPPTTQLRSPAAGAIGKEESGKNNLGAAKEEEPGTLRENEQVFLEKALRSLAAFAFSGVAC